MCFLILYKFPKSKSVMKVTWDTNATCTCTNYLYLIKTLKQPFMAGFLTYTPCIMLCSFMEKK